MRGQDGGNNSDPTPSDGDAGTGAGIWTRNITRAYRFGRAIQAGRVWTNCYHAYPAHAAFGGYKASGIGRELGPEGLAGYLESRQINLPYGYEPKIQG